MGIALRIGNYPVEAIDYSVDESSTPLAAGDTSGGTGGFSVTLVKPGEYVHGDAMAGTFWATYAKYGAEYFIDMAVRLDDSKRGFTLGTITSFDENDDWTVSFNCDSRMSALNVYNIQTQPFTGTLHDAFEYYLGLALDTDYYVDPGIPSMTVSYPGWNGELWYNLKMLAASVDCEISLVSGVVLVRPIRQRVAQRGRETGRTVTVPAPRLAQFVEVYMYSNTAITDKLVYPPGGWTPNTEVLTVNAGMTVEYTVELSASVTSIRPARFVPSMAEYDWSTTSSDYTVLGDSDVQITESEWTDGGGRVSLEILSDTRTVRVRISAPDNIINTDGTPHKTFSLAATNGDGLRFGALRITGSGVAFNKQKVQIPTSVSASMTATEVGETIDNPYINTLNDVYRVGVRAAKRYAAMAIQMSANVLSINRRGDTGSAAYPKYSTVEAAYATYGDAQAAYATIGDGTYGAVQDYWFATVRDTVENQTFGNVAGSRVWDDARAMWFRVRDATIKADGISISGDDDLTHSDMASKYGAVTYGDVQALYSGMTYKQAHMVGPEVG